MGPANIIFSFSQYIFQALQVAAIRCGWGVCVVFAACLMWMDASGRVVAHKQLLKPTVGCLLSQATELAVQPI